MRKVCYDRSPIVTPDGWRLQLFRSPASKGGDQRGRPVLLLPGANANHLGFGVERKTSLARTLNDLGRDVWLLDWRGSRSAIWEGTGRGPVTLDHKLELDLPTAIARIMDATGADRVDLVGHSLGGLLIYLACGGPDDSLAGRIGRCVTISAPATLRDFFGPWSPIMRAPAAALAPVAAGLGGLGLDRLLRSPLLGSAIAGHKHLSRRGLPRRIRKGWLARGVEDMPGGELSQLMTWIAERRLCDRFGADYEDRFARVHHPTRVIASATDRFIPPSWVKEGFDRLGAEDKDFVLLGKKHGHARDYAHSDVLLAPAARRDVFPAIADWLDRPLSSELAEPEVERSRGTGAGSEVEHQLEAGQHDRRTWRLRRN